MATLLVNRQLGTARVCGTAMPTAVVFAENAGYIVIKVPGHKYRSDLMNMSYAATELRVFRKVSDSGEEQRDAHSGFRGTAITVAECIAFDVRSVPARSTA